MNGMNKILVVDDDADMCWSLKKLLQSGCYDVTTADCGGIALAYLKKSSFDLVILDARLPDIHGLELAQIIRDGFRLKLPIILVSGYLYPNDMVVQQRLQVGLITKFVSKPFFHDDLMEIVRRTIAE